MGWVLLNALGVKPASIRFKISHLIFFSTSRGYQGGHVAYNPCQIAFMHVRYPSYLFRLIKYVQSLSRRSQVKNCNFSMSYIRWIYVRKVLCVLRNFRDGLHDRYFFFYCTLCTPVLFEDLSM